MRYLLSMESQRTSNDMPNSIGKIHAKYQFSIPFFTQYHIRDNVTLAKLQNDILTSKRTTLFAFCGSIRYGKNTKHWENGRKEFNEQLHNISDAEILNGSTWEGMKLFEIR